MISQFKNHIDKYFSFLKDQKLLLAVSGGVDSVVLVHVLHTLGYEIGIAHVNFKLRGAESDGDETFVKSLAEKLQLPFFSKKTDTETFAKSHGLSIQMAARQLRYDWFDVLIKEHDYDYLLTAHHLDDSIETFIININRKTGLEGLSGIKSINGHIIRPLSDFTRENIVAYAKQNGLEWREDRSNASIKYERNHIRHKLIPVWETINPDFKTDLKQTMTYLSESQALIEDYLALIKPKFWTKTNHGFTIDLEQLKVVSHFESILYHCLKPYGFTDWTAINNLMESQSGKQVMSEDYTLLKDRSKLLLNKNQARISSTKTIGDSFSINNITYTITRFQDNSSINIGSADTEYFDTKSIRFPLSIRPWRKGDYFYPLGMNGKKLISDFFTDQKLSLFEKEKIWLLCDALDRIIWIIDYRIDNRFKITDQTKSYLKITKTL